MENYSVLSLLPPILVLLFGYITKRVVLSLFIGIISASLIAANYNFLTSLNLIGEYLWRNLELDKFLSTNNFWDTYNLFICIFLFMLGIFVTLLQYSGGAFAYGAFIKKYIKNKKSAESSSLVLSSLLFLDDYFSSLTVGSVMQPLTDSQKVPRAKLAFLVDSMAAPLAILCPFSSWVAATLGFLRENGISDVHTEETLVLASPLSTYFHIIPYILYSFVLILCTWYIVKKRISFGPMYEHEKLAVDTGDLLGGAKPAKEPKQDFNHTKDNTSLIDFFTPVLTLLFCILFGMLFSGNYHLFGGHRSFFLALQNSNAAVALFTGGGAALLFCTVFFVVRGKVSLKSIPKVYWEGVDLMFTAILVLMLAWTLGDILRYDLFTGQYLANLMIGSVSINLLPFILFVTATLIAFSIGSSWGTAAMLFPIAIPLTVSMLDLNSVPTINEVPILFPILGAVLSGCVAGDHISPISDTTIMSATSSRTPYMEHFRTQLPYALPVIFATSIAFLLITWLIQYGVVISMLLSFLAASVISIVMLNLLNKPNLETVKS